MNSREILQALRHINVRHAGVYPADRVPWVWTRSTAIVANTDEHNRPGEHWPPTLTATEYHPCNLDFSFDSDETPLFIVGILNNYKEFFRKHAGTIVAYFYIICVMVMILIDFLVFSPKIANITIV
ncbi:hypothetical protein ACFW04_012811 [Cataglyphis niger]